MVGIITSNECRIQTVEGHETRGVFERIQSGDEDAAREVFDRYLTRLVALARSRLSEKLARKVDADDIVQSALRSFFVRARDGQYAIERAGDLWALLASITKHKLLKKARHFGQQRGDAGVEQRLPDAKCVDNNAAFSDPPSDEEAIALADEVEAMMRELEPMQREMLELRLQGKTIPEVAAAVERSERTVRRFLGNFRDQLETRFKALSE